MRQAGAVAVAMLASVAWAQDTPTPNLAQAGSGAAGGVAQIALAHGSMRRALPDATRPMR